MTVQIEDVIAELQALADGRLPSDHFYVHVPSRRTETGAHTFAYPSYTARMQAIDAALRIAGYDPHAVLDYDQWLGRFAGNPFDADAIACMTSDDLRHWTVWSGRGERFCDGFMAGLVDKGLYLAALRRARELGPPAAP